MKNIILIIGLFWIVVIQVSGFVILYQAITNPPEIELECNP